MKSNQGIIDDKEMAARLRFWNKRGFFGEPDKKAIERDSMKMQKLVKAMQGHTAEEIRRMNATPYYLRRKWNAADTLIATASKSDIDHAILTFKIL